MSETRVEDQVPLVYGVGDPIDRSFPARSFTRAMLIFLVVPPAAAFLMTLPLNMPESAFSGPRRYEIELTVIAIGAIALCALIMAFVRCMAYPSSRRHVRLPLIGIALLWLSCSTAGGLANNMWAFDGRFSGNRSALDLLVAKIKAGDVLTPPVAGGVYTFEDVRLQPDGVIVFISSKGNGGLWGFAYAPNATTELKDVEALGLTGDAFRFQGIRKLEGPWYVLYHRYWYGKRGWS